MSAIEWRDLACSFFGLVRLTECCRGLELDVRVFCTTFVWFVPGPTRWYLGLYWKWIRTCYPGNTTVVVFLRRQLHHVLAGTMPKSRVCPVASRTLHSPFGGYEIPRIIALWVAFCLPKYNRKVVFSRDCGTVSHNFGQHNPSICKKVQPSSNHPVAIRNTLN